MTLTNLSSAQLERLVQLVKEKETLQARLDQLNRALDALGKGHASSESKTGGTKARTGGRRRRVGLRDALLKSLEAAGKDGVTVKELANKLKAKPSSVSVWFYTTGKKIKGIKKVGPARFAYLLE
jgi:hypothetical protein